MPPKASCSKAKAKTTTAKAATRSQSKSKSPVEELQTDSDSDTCVCEIPTTTMDATQKEEFKEFFRSFLTKMKGDFEKESEMQRTRLDSLSYQAETQRTADQFTDYCTELLPRPLRLEETNKFENSNDDFDGG